MLQLGEQSKLSRGLFNQTYVNLQVHAIMRLCNVLVGMSNHPNIESLFQIPNQSFVWAVKTNKQKNFTFTFSKYFYIHHFRKAQSGKWFTDLNWSTDYLFCCKCDVKPEIKETCVAKEVVWTVLWTTVTTLAQNTCSLLKFLSSLHQNKAIGSSSVVFLIRATCSAIHYTFDDSQL